MKKAMTVSGAVPADELGHILPHEHILMEFPPLDKKPMYPELANRKVSMEILGKLRRDIWSCAENLRLDEPEVAFEELSSFKINGGGTIVDVTTIGLKRNVAAVADLAQRSGVNVIVGTGYYVQAGHPAEVAGLALEDIQRWMVRELCEGVEGTHIRAGVIGEIGISSPAHPDEVKVLRAGLRAQRETGAPLTVHQYEGDEIVMIDNIVRQEGADPQKIILCHMSSASPEQRLWAAQLGYYVEFDCFGNEYYLDAMQGRIRRDPDRIKMVKEMIDHGYLNQVLVSNDLALKIMQKKYGGWGYEHIKVNIKPFMLRMGLPPKAIDTLLYYNPMRIMAYLD